MGVLAAHSVGCEDVLDLALTLAPQYTSLVTTQIAIGQSEFSIDSSNRVGIRRSIPRNGDHDW